MANDESEVAPIDAPEPLDEVLQQTSEQTLKLAHIDDGVRDLRGAVSDLGDTMAAGLIELRGVVTQQQPQQAATGGLDDAVLRPLADRLDELERRQGKVAGRLGLLVVVALLQLVGVGVLAALAFGFIGQATPPPPAAVAPAVTPAVAEPAPEPVIPEPPPTKKKKRR